MSLMYNNNLPSIDLHGENRGSARVLVKEFIIDCYSMGRYELAIIHGIGQGILKKEVHDMLRISKYVDEFKLDNFNSGCTLVKLKENIDKKALKEYNNRHNSKGEKI